MLKYLVYAVSGVVGLIVLLLVLLLLTMQTEWGRERVKNLAVSQANSLLVDAELDIGELDGNLVTGLALYDVRLEKTNGGRLAQVDTLAASYRLLPLLQRRVKLTDVYIARPRVWMTQQPDSTWDLFNILPSDTAAADTTQPMQIELDRFDLRDGRLEATYHAPARDSALRVDDLNVRLGSAEFGRSLAVRLDTARARIAPPGRTGEPIHFAAGGAIDEDQLVLDGLVLSSPHSDVTGHGTLAMPSSDRPDPESEETRDFDFALQAHPLAFRDLQPFLPGLPPEGTLTLDAHVTGGPSMVRATLDARTSDGGQIELSAEMSPPGEGDTFYRAEGEVRGFDPSFLTGNPAHAGHVNADLDVDLRGAAPEQVGGHANLVLFDWRIGTYVPDRTTLESTFTDGAGNVALRTGEGGTVLTLDGSVRPFDAEPRYDLQGVLANLDLGRYSAGNMQSDITARLRLEGQGLDPQTANTDASLELDRSRINSYVLQDGRIAAGVQDGRIDLEAFLRLPEGSIAMAGDAELGPEPTFRLHRGEIEGLDVAALSGDTTRSSVNGTFTLEGRGSDPQAMQLDARMHLSGTYYGPYTLEEASLNADLRGGRLDLGGNADLGDGGSLSWTASARPFDAVPAFAISRAQFRGLDLGAITQNPAQRSDLNGSLSLQGRGAEPATMSLDARLDVSESSLNEQQIESALVTVDLRSGQVRFDSRLMLPEGGFVLAGSARPFDATPVYAVDRGAFDGLDVGALTGNPGLTTNLNGSVRLTGAGADPRDMTLDAVLDLDRSTVNEAVLRDGRVSAGVRGGRADVDSQIDLAEGSFTLRAAADFSGEQPTYEAHGRVQDFDLSQFAPNQLASSQAAPNQITPDQITPDQASDQGSRTGTTSGRLTMTVDLEGAGTAPETMRLEGRIEAREGAYADVSLDTLDARFRLAGGVLEVDSLILRSNVADARAAGPIALFDTLGSRPSDFRLELDVTSVEPIGPLIGADLFSLQDAHLEATVSGPSDRLELSASGEINSLIYNALRLAGFEGRFDGSLGPDRTLQQGDLEVDLNYLSTANLDVRRTHAEASYDGAEAGFVVETLLDERREGRISGLLDVRPESRRLQIENLGMRFDEDRWTLAQPATIGYGDGVRVSNFSLASGTQRILVDGVIDPDSTQNFQVQVDSLRLAGFADLFGFEQLGGTLETRLELTGPADDPLLEGTLGVNLQHDDRDIGDVRLDVDYGDRRLNLDALLTHLGGSTLTLTGGVPLDLTLARTDDAPAEDGTRDDAPGDDAPATQAATVSEASGPIDLRLESSAFALEMLRPFLDPETVGELRGRLNTDVRIGGALDAPELDGTFGLNEGRLLLTELSVTYDDIQVEGTLRDNNVVLDRVEMRAGGGELHGSGRIEMPELTLGRFEVSADLNDFRAIDSDQYRATVSGDVSVSGTTEAPVVSGTLRLFDSDFHLGGSAGGDIREVELTAEDVRMLEQFFGYRVSEGDTTTSSMYEAMALEVDVEVERDTWIRQSANPEIAIEMTGRLEVRKEPQEELQLFRSIEVVPQRSYIRQFGRRFDLTEGTITFNGPIEELVMDVTAEYEVRSRFNPGQPEAVILLTLNGRLDDLELALSSDPPMDNTDIVSYIATGRPAGRALAVDGGGGEGGGLVSAGGGLAANELAGVVEGVAGEELGLDVVEIHQDGLRGTQLVAGKYVAPKIYVGINQSIALSSAGNAPTGTLPTEVTLEYEVFEWMLLQVLSGTSSASVRLNVMGKHAFE